MALELGERHAGGGKIATMPIVFTNDSKYAPRIGGLRTQPNFMVPTLSNLFLALDLPSSESILKALTNSHCITDLDTSSVPAAIL